MAGTSQTSNFWATKSIIGCILLGPVNLRVLSGKPRDLIFKSSSVLNKDFPFFLPLDGQAPAASKGPCPACGECFEPPQPWEPTQGVARAFKSSPHFDAVLSTLCGPHPPRSHGATNTSTQRASWGVLS